MEVVESRYGKLIASPHDYYIGRGLIKYGEFSEGEVEMFRRVIQKTDIVCDVGANIGAHTLAFARLAKHVYAFEPIPKLFNALAGMVALNDLDNVSCMQCGIGEKEGVMTYMDIVTDSENNFGAAPLQEYDGGHAVSIYPLSTECHFLKIDVEGMECEVLRGARSMIDKCKPTLYVEADRLSRYEELVTLIGELGYTPYWHTPPLFNEKNHRGVEERIWKDVISVNLLCTPVPVSGWDEAIAAPDVKKHPFVSQTYGGVFL